MIAARLSAAPERTLGVPAEVERAQRSPAKQFQLWDVKREEDMEPTEDRDRVPAPRVYEDIQQRPEIPRFLPEASLELLALTLSSAAARKAYKGWRALLKIALRKPYKREPEA
ncbi:MAG: hypothetical protein ACRELB_14290 [Polyangiaceae bacterium]